MLIELSGARKYQQFIEISTDIGFFFFKMTPPFELTVYWCVEGLQCLVTPLRERVVRGSTALEKSLDRFLQWNHQTVHINQPQVQFCFTININQLISKLSKVKQIEQGGEYTYLFFASLGGLCFVCLCSGCRRGFLLRLSL